MIDHLLRFPSVFEFATGRGLLWVSAAEGFFFLSGLVLILVRSRQLERSGWRAVVNASLKRAGQLWLINILLTLLFTVIGRYAAQVSPEQVKAGLDTSSSLLGIALRTAGLNYSYGWADFLMYYVVLLLLTPLLLLALRHGLAWLVCLASLATYLLVHPAQFFAGSMAGYIVVWQAFFVSGVLAGHYWPRLTGRWRSLRADQKSKTTAVVVGLAAIAIIASFVYTFVPTFFADKTALTDRVPFATQTVQTITQQSAELNPYLQDNRTGFLRLPMFWLWMAAGFLAMRALQPIVMRWLGWFLLPFGRNSLYIYIMQSVVVFGLALAPVPRNPIFNTLMGALALGILWLLVRHRVLLGIIPK